MIYSFLTIFEKIYLYNRAHLIDYFLHRTYWIIIFDTISYFSLILRIFYLSSLLSYVYDTCHRYFEFIEKN